MQLEINNVAKIKEAKIKVDGLTVIAGENNTGKSTIGKLLFTIFNSMNSMEKKIEFRRNNKIREILNRLLQNYEMRNVENRVEYIRYPFTSRKAIEKIVEALQSGNDEEVSKQLKGIIDRENFSQNRDDIADFINESLLRLKSIYNISDKKVMIEVITRWFNNVFESQISPIIDENVESKICLTIKNKIIEYNFKENTCVDWNSEFNILHQAFYIDNPFVVDYMSDRLLRSSIKTTDEYLLRHLCKEEDDIFDDVFDAVIAKDKLDDIYSMLGEIIGGEIIENQDGEYCLKSNQFSKPINIKNLSTGLKSFALIKRLLENGSLKEKDVLILDEPEIHLHPEWQLLYAKLIVLLQKKFDLTMIITTHSPYFLDAIDVYSSKYEMSDKVNYYLAENKGVFSYLHDVTNNIDAIYKKLSDPMQKLENMRSELM